MPVNSFENYPMTWKPNKDQLTTPLYLSIANLLEYDIINGYLAPNTKLPPQRELADYLDINLSTITRAFKICELKGLIYAKTGKGTFVAPNAGTTITIVDSEVEKNYIEMGLIKPFDQFNLLVVETAKSILAKGYLEKLLDYSHPLGTPYHKMSAGKWLKKYNMDADIENIAITSGAQNSVTLTLISLFHSGDKIAVDMYTYPNFIALANMLNIQLIPIKGDPLGMKPEELDAQCKLNNIQGIYLTPSCNNPTAILMNMERRQEIASVIKKNNLILIEDDIYAFLAPQNYLPITCFAPEQSIYISSVSKSLCSGMRVAFMFYPKKYSSNIIRGIYNINVKTSALNIEIIAEIINTGMADKIVEEKISIAKERNEIYKKYFQIENPNENPISFFRWLPLRQKFNANQFEKNALAQGIKIYHSNRFLVGNYEEKQFLRVSLSSMADSNELEKGLDILKNILLEPKDKSNINSLII
ncbi:PLP-dependent aminotransferase family protein [Clostridium formicaceticum]|uniref:GntR family transcriptional regulator n=1 Tax=Clostridium formicaceticum TaxID=1497 RepID=A0AAC9RKU4_9CLOT|nr:PLP-dependent aminotransferase family protein [Clostridium formicaceticum]AOY74578.1 GntR family transcriptional regulator [Clostridium formicaceticum]ARE88939.1 putative HTH-type transcriptional regulator YjiR [Clostridium formicaceticum]